jgi:hypothetical protein
MQGQKVHGILGMDFLKKHVVRIDFDKGEVAFLRSPGGNPGQRVPLTFRSELPVVTATVPGMVGLEFFVVDTGCVTLDSGILRAEAFSMLHSQVGLLRAGADVGYVTLAGESSTRQGHLEALSLEGHRHKRLAFSEGSYNILSLHYLSRYTATFDFPRGVVYLKKGRRYAQPDIVDTSGIWPVRKKGQTVVKEVKKGSRAAHGGVLPNDVLLAVDDRPASQLSLLGIEKVLGSKSSKHRLQVLRKGTQLELLIDAPHEQRGGILTRAAAAPVSPGQTR